MQILAWEFHPKWWSSILTLVIVTLFLKLSIWQWHRYHYKQALAASYQSQMQAAPLSLTQALASPLLKEGVFLKVELQGHYIQKQFLLDNRSQHGQIGFDVISPFIPDALPNTAILVNRGFVKTNIHRELLQSIDPPTQNIHITGLLCLPSKAFILGNVIEPHASRAGPYLIMRIDPPLLAQSLAMPLLPFIILLDPTDSFGFSRIWSPPDFSAERSLGYCFQWLALALTLIIIYIVMNTKRKKNHV